jgi:hypothetical protein
MAVDNEYAKRDPSHELYADSVSYNRQFEWRKKAATEHIRTAYKSRGA